MASAQRNTLDRLQSFQNRLVENKQSVDAQISLSGRWSFSVDSDDNMVIKNGSVIHTTITPSGDITAPALKIPNGPSISGSSISGITNSDIASAPRPYLATHVPISSYTTPIAPLGYVVATSADGLTVAGSSGLDGSVIYGTVKVYKTAPTFAVLTTLTPPSGLLDATMFGSAIRVNADGSRIYVGEPVIDSVHIFARQNDGTWLLENTIVGPYSGAMFGVSIAVSNDTFLVVGAKGTYSNTGAVHIYERSKSGWARKTNIIGNSDIANYQLGVNVEISGNGSLIIASAVGSSTIQAASGTVEIYKKLKARSIWTKIKSLVSPLTPGPSTLFGGAIDISDDSSFIFVGDAEMPVGVASGNVHVYINISDNWIYLKTFSDGRHADARFGWAVKERNGMLLVGSPGDNDNGASANDGRVMVYKRQRNDWVYSHLIEPTVTASFFGLSIAMATSDLFAVSGPYFGNGYIFAYEPSGYTFSGVTLRTGTLLPTLANTSDIGNISGPYTDMYVQNTPTTTSDRNAKKNIRDVERGIDFVKKLQPVEFEWKENEDGKHVGFIGQDVAEAAGESSGIAIGDESRVMIRPSEMLASLVSTYQHLHAKVQLLEAQE